MAQQEVAAVARRLGSARARSVAAPASPAEDESVGSHTHPDCFANAMRMTIAIGQVFSLLPTEPVSGRRSAPRTAYAAVLWLCLSAITVLAVLNELQRPTISIQGLVRPVFYGMNSLTALLYIRLAGQWKHVLRAFHLQDRRHGPVPHLRLRLNSIAILLLGMATMEHVLSQLHVALHLRAKHPNIFTFSEGLKEYEASQFPMIHRIVGHCPPLSIFLFFLQITATFIWNFNDVFIMLVSVAIAERFRLLNESLQLAVCDVLKVRRGAEERPAMGTAFWQASRLTYNSFSGLTRLVDRALSVHLLVSFTSNLYFICMQLLKGFDEPPDGTWYRTLYIAFSFSFLIVRTAAVSMFAASVRERSRGIKDTLYRVASDDYNQEVYRFLIQVTCEEVALTGYNMFNVTRPLLLRVAGTIFTYEVVLVQLKYN